MRALVGALVVVASVVAALAIYTRIGNRTEVLAVARDVLAGEQISDDDLEVVSISSDDGIPTVPASQRNTIVGQYARVRLLSGSLLVADSVQAKPLVDPDRVLMSVVVPVGLVPVGLREQSRVVLVVTPPTPAASARHRSSSRPSSPPCRATSARSSVRPTPVRGWSPSAVEVPPPYVGVVGEAEAVSVGVLDGSAPFPSAQVEASSAAATPGAAESAATPGRRRCGAT